MWRKARVNDAKGELYSPKTFHPAERPHFGVKGGVLPRVRTTTLVIAALSTFLGQERQAPCQYLQRGAEQREPEVVPTIDVDIPGIPLKELKFTP